MKQRKRNSIIVISTLILVALIGFGLIMGNANEFIKATRMSLATNSTNDTNDPVGSDPGQPEEPDLEQPGQPDSEEPEARRRKSTLYSAGF